MFDRNCTLLKLRRSCTRLTNNKWNTITEDETCNCTTWWHAIITSTLRQPNNAQIWGSTCMGGTSQAINFGNETTRAANNGWEVTVILQAWCDNTLKSKLQIHRVAARRHVCELPKWPLTGHIPSPHFPCVQEPNKLRKFAQAPCDQSNRAVSRY